MPSPNRIGQINGEIHRVLARQIAMLKDPRVVGLCSIVRVDTSNDLSLCRVYVSAMENGETVLQGLKSAGGFLRRELGHTLSLRHTPALQFILDTSIRRGAEITELLRGVKPSSQEEPEAPV